MDCETPPHWSIDISLMIFIFLLLELRREGNSLAHLLALWAAICNSSGLSPSLARLL